MNTRKATVKRMREKGYNNINDQTITMEIMSLKQECVEKEDIRKVCMLYASGMTWTDASVKAGIHPYIAKRCVDMWKHDDKIKALYDGAKKSNAQVMADMSVKVAFSEEDSGLAAVKVKACQWAAEKGDPGEFGHKTQVGLTVENVTHVGVL